MFITESQKVHITTNKTVETMTIFLPKDVAAILRDVHSLPFFHLVIIFQKGVEPA